MELTPRIELTTLLVVVDSRLYEFNTFYYTGKHLTLDLNTLT